MSVTIHQGSILDAKTDVIVNPANGHLRHGGGLAAVIDRAAQGSNYGADPYILRQLAAEGHIYAGDFNKVAQYIEDHEAAPLIATGNAHATSAGRLPYKAIIHAVGPIWNGGAFHERALLRSAHLEACAKAYELRCRSIAFPAVSCGIFGFPVGQAAGIAIDAVSKFWAVEQPHGVGLAVEFWLFEDAHVAAYTDALAGLR